MFMTAVRVIKIQTSPCKHITFPTNKTDQQLVKVTLETLHPVMLIPLIYISGNMSVTQLIFHSVVNSSSHIFAQLIAIRFKERLKMNFRFGNKHLTEVVFIVLISIY